MNDFSDTPPTDSQPTDSQPADSQPADSRPSDSRPTDSRLADGAVSDLSALSPLLEEFDEIRVLCLGDVMLDRFVYGGVDRISPEAPIPVMAIEREESMPGGAGNVVRNIAALGATGILVSVVGDDEAARELRAMMAENEKLEARLITDGARPTTVKTRYVAAGQQLLRADRETARALSAEAEAALLAAYEDALWEVEAVVLSDYAKGVLGQGLLEKAIRLARDAGIPVIADPKSTDFARYRGVSVLTPNRKEMAAASRLPCDSDQEVAEAAREILAETGLDALLVTRSEAGMTLAEKNGQTVHIPARAREVFDVSGAGDSVIATLAVAIAAGASAQDAARLANLAGGIVVAKAGTATVHVDELAAEMHTADVLSAEAKVTTLHGALDHVARWRARGLRIGFTNGCFDLIHPGHVSLLAQARAACDRLIVGMNSDESVRRLKGPERPIQNEAAREIVLASLGSVDLVVPFGEDTPLRLIGEIRPDVLVKGADYTVEQVVGADIVLGYGGQVKLADLKQGHSTTSTISRINTGGGAGEQAGGGETEDASQ